MSRKLFFILGLILGLICGFSRGVMAASGITANPAALDFGDQAEGTLGPSQAVTLTNQFNGDGIIGAVVMAGQDPLQFVILEDFCSGTVLANQDSCSLEVAYFPSAEFPNGEGPAEAEIQINFQAPPALSIPLSGNSLVPNIVSSVASLDFGKKVAGQLSDPQSVVLTNTGEADLIIGTARTSDGDTVDFGPSLDECTFQTLGPGESCSLELNMRPTALGDRSAAFTIESNDPDTPLLSIELSGVGTGSGGCGQISSGTDPSGWALGLLLLLGWVLAKRKKASGASTLPNARKR